MIWSIASNIANVFIGVAALISLVFVIQFERTRRRGADEDRIRSKLERACVALGTACGVCLVQSGHNTRKLNWLYFLSDISLTLKINDAQLMLFAAAAALRSERQTPTMKRVLVLLGEASSIDSEKKVQIAMEQYLKLMEQLLHEISYPPSRFKKMFNRLKFW